MASPAHLVVGTAGHIDHGKTSLVRALTGVDLDRLPEERARGITIALGFTWLDLDDGRRLALVDVPGHERLVRTMVAGASGLDAVLLCVSAVEGVMPQTREHLDILGLLGVAHGVVALTMADLVDDEMLELAMLDVEEVVAGTFLEGAPVIATSAGDPPRGLDAVRAALGAVPAPVRDMDGPFRLPVDRAFVQRGFGTVVTGTVRSGSIRDGEDVVVQPEGLKARVRGVEVHGERADAAGVGHRAALNLAGVERDDLHRGAVVMRAGVAEPASILDLAYRHLEAAPPLADGARARLLVGTAEVMGVVTVLDPDLDQLSPGWSGFVQVRTDSPVLALPGDRCVLRRESPVETLGGGAVLDPWSRRARRRDQARMRDELAALAAGDRDVLLERAGDLGLPPAGATLRRCPGGVGIADRVLHPDRVARLEELLLEALSAYHAGSPLSPGAPKRELHRPPLGHLSGPVFDELVARLADRGAVVVEGPRLRRPDFAVRLSPAQAARQAALAAQVAAAGLEGPRAGDLLSTDPALVHLLVEAGTLVRVSDKLLHHTHLDALRDRVVAHLEAHGRLEPTTFKDLTGLSRKHAIPLLEWLDAQRITVRDGDARRLRRP